MLSRIYGGREIPIEIGKFKDSYNKDRKSKYFNCNIYRYIVNDCLKPKKKKETKKCYICNKVEYLAKDYKIKQKIKNKSTQKDIDEENNDK